MSKITQYKEVLEVCLVCWGFGMLFALGTISIIFLIRMAYFAITAR